MSLYRLSWEEVSERMGKPRKYVEYFEAANDSAAVTAVNNRLPEGTTSEKLYKVGTEVSLE